jgi:nitrogen regulatory protein P-II 1
MSAPPPPFGERQQSQIMLTLRSEFRRPRFDSGSRNVSRPGRSIFCLVRYKRPGAAGSSGIFLFGPCQNILDRLKRKKVAGFEGTVDTGQPETGDMKKIEAIIKPFKLEDVKNALIEVGIEGMTTMDVKGFGNQKGPEEIYRGSDYTAEFVPMVLILVVVADSVAESAIRAIQRAGKTGYIGDGKIFVSTIDEAFRIRISERGETPV